MIVNIDDSAGFCWGVVQTIDKVEDVLQNDTENDIFVLGNIIHNPKEIDRLEEKGLTTINHIDLEKLDASKTKVIIRAHGEPPATYKKAEELGLEIVDATCPLVKGLQQSVKNYFEKDWQIIIFGKKEHAEIIGLRGVCDDNCIVVKTPEQALQLADFNKKTILFSQTTMDKPTYAAINDALKAKFEEIHGAEKANELYSSKNSICRFVSKREDGLIEFAKSNDYIIFVAGKSSSNGKILFDICKNANDNTIFVEDVKELDYNIIKSAGKVGVTGATSTPQWYLQQVRTTIENYFNNN